MNEYQKKAWDCLTPTEQQSLFLQLSESKSSWEAGEILKLSHYKYLEIKERSEKFFRLFSDFFEILSQYLDQIAHVKETSRIISRLA